MSLIRMLSFRKILFENLPNFCKKNFLYPDFTIFVEANYDFCEKRRMERDKGTKKFKLPISKIKGFFLIESLKRDLKFARKNGFIEVIYYNNEREFNPLFKEEIIKIIKSEKYGKGISGDSSL